MRIDVGLLYKSGKLGPGNCRVISCSIRTGFVGTVRVVAKTDAIELSGTSRPPRRLSR